MMYDAQADSIYTTVIAHAKVSKSGRSPGLNNKEVVCDHVNNTRLHKAAEDDVALHVQRGAEMEEVGPEQLISTQRKEAQTGSNTSNLLKHLCLTISRRVRSGERELQS